MKTEEQEQLSIKEKSKLFVELLEKRKTHFATLRAQEKWSKQPTKAQKRNIMSTYLKNMAGYKYNQLKSKKLVKGSKTKAEGSFKRADDEVAIDAIPLATKPPVIVEWKIIKEGKMGYFKLIKADGSLKRNTRPEEAYERVLWGDLNVMFQPDIESEVWRSLEGHNVTVWKLFSSSGVHFTLLECTKRLGLYNSEEIKEEGFDVYFQGGLRYDDHFNAQEYWLSTNQEDNLSLSRTRHQNGYANVAWLIARWMKRKGDGSQKESMICCGQFITKIAKRKNLLSEELLNSFSAPIYCRALDTTTLS
ncbi:hypothetical protein Tco_1540101 [Tanacetum coccineum]